jgi:hypothetical protein
MPHFTTNFSPFVVRVRPGRRREETINKNGSMKNPSLTGHSTSSTASSARYLLKMLEYYINNISFIEVIKVI